MIAEMLGDEWEIPSQVLYIDDDVMVVITATRRHTTRTAYLVRIHVGRGTMPVIVRECLVFRWKHILDVARSEAAKVREEQRAFAANARLN